MSTAALLPLAYVFRVNHTLRAGGFFYKFMPTKERIQLVEDLADLEHRLATGTHERLQLGALCATFVKAREGIAAAAQ